MKGIIANCLKELVCEKFGEDKWEEILQTSGLDTVYMIQPSENIDDELVLRMIDSTCKVLNITQVQAADAFGEYWVNVFAPRVYHVYYKGVDSAKDFLLKMDEIHKKVTNDIEGSKPPSFEYELTSENKLIINYKSERGLIDILIGLIKGVGKYFKEDLAVKKLSDNKVEVIFPE